MSSLAFFEVSLIFSSIRRSEQDATIYIIKAFLLLQSNNCSLRGIALSAGVDQARRSRARSWHRARLGPGRESLRFCHPERENPPARGNSERVGRLGAMGTTAGDLIATRSVELQKKRSRNLKFRERFQNGGGRRTRTFEAIRRLIYSQLPLPLGTLPRMPSNVTHRIVAGPTVDDIESPGPDTGPAVRRVYGGSTPAKSTNSRGNIGFRCG